MLSKKQHPPSSVLHRVAGVGEGQLAGRQWGALILFYKISKEISNFFLTNEIKFFFKKRMVKMAKICINFKGKG